MKFFKKISAAILAVLLCAGLFTGCSSSTSLTADMTEENVEATLQVVFDALVKFDTDDLKNYVDSSTLDSIISYAKKYSQFTDLAKAMFANLSYDIDEIDLETESIYLTVYNKDLYDAAYEFVDNLTENYSTIQLLGKLTDSDWLDTNLQLLEDEIEDSPMDPFGEEIILTISQKSDNLVLEFDTEAEDAVSGGALGAITRLF